MERIFYTRCGDKGTSRVTKTKIVAKTDPVIGVLGDLDELNSLFGLVRTQKISAHSKKVLRFVQEDLFIIQAQIALLLIGGSQKMKAFPLDKVGRLEQEIDVLEKIVKLKRKFVVAGSNEASAWFDYCRAVSRRVERSTVKLCKTADNRASIFAKASEGRGISWTILAYLNRLSSLLYALARREAKRKGVLEEHPRYS